jgi:hypothetical protein
MTRQCLIPLLFFSLLLPPASMAQRYGRPYSMAESPQILLLVKAEKNHHYFRPADLRKMQRTVVTEVDAVTNAPHTYEGVALEQLLPSAALSSPGEVIEVEYGSHQTIVIPANNLDNQTKVIIADTVDGKQLTGDAPYCFVIKSRYKPFQKLSEVETITVKSSH